MSYNSVVLADSPIGYWRLGELSGTSAADASGNSRNGTYNNVTLNQTGLDGSTDKAVAFNGTSSYVTIPSSGLALSGIVSVECLFKIGTVPPSSAYSLVTKGYDGTNEDYMLQLGSSMNLTFGKYIAAGGITDQTSFVVGWAAGETHHLVGTFDGTNWNVYIDGVLKSTTATNHAGGDGAVSNGTAVLIGANNLNGTINRFTNGTIDEVAIYNTALTSAKILAHAAAAGFAVLSPGTTSASATGSSTATVSNTAAANGTAPYTFQYQRAPDSSGVPGTFANVGSAQSGVASATAPTNLSDTSLSASTKYWYRVSVTDSASTNTTSAPVSITTSASVLTITSATANANGTQVDLVFSQSVTGVNAADFAVIIGGYPVALSGVSGSGTAWSLLFAVGNWVYGGQTVSVGYWGSGVASLAHATITGSNSSARVKKQIVQNNRGFGAFIHFSGATFNMVNPPSQADANSKFNPTSLNIDQWLSTVQAMGVRYTVLTTKHDNSFCMWPSASGAPHIGATPWYATTPIDVVQQYTSKARALGLGVGLYLNFYDPWFTGSRTGHDGTYGSGTTFLNYITTQITELLSNYGQIDELWIDSWSESNGPQYTLVPVATIRALVTSLQPNCILINNDHALNLTNTDIMCLEADTGGDFIPASSNLLPAEYCQTCRTDNNWTWATSGSGNTSFKDIYALASSYQTMRAARTNYLLNIPPDNTGVMPSYQVTWCNQLGAIMGIKGGPLLPIPGNVKYGVDRGDMLLGTLNPSRGFVG